MGEDVAPRVFSREDRQRYRQKVRTCLDVFARMLSEAASTPSCGRWARDRAQPDRRGGRPGDAQAPSLAIADPDFPTELAQFNVEINILPPCSRRTALELEDTCGEPQRRRGQARGVGAHLMLVGSCPPSPPTNTSTARRYARTRATGLLNEQIFAARGEDLRSASRRRAAVHVRRHDRARGGVHERAARTTWSIRRLRPPWNAAWAIAGCSSRSAPTRRSSSLRAVAGDADRAVRAGHRHAGRRSSRRRACARAVVRRALDHLDLRPLRGERHPTSPRCCRSATPRTRSRCSTPATVPAARRAAPPQRARSTAGTGRSTTSCAASRTCGSRTASCPPGRPSSTRSPTPRFYYGSCGCSPRERPIWSRMSFSAAEENFHAGARDGIDARVFWPELGEVPASTRPAAAAPARARGARPLGDRRPRPRPAARDHRAALRAAQRRDLAGRDVPPPLRRRGAGSRRGARDDGALPRSSCTRTNRSTLAAGGWRRFTSRFRVLLWTGPRRPGPPDATMSHVVLLSTDAAPSRRPRATLSASTPNRSSSGSRPCVPARIAVAGVVAPLSPVSSRPWLPLARTRGRAGTPKRRLLARCARW